MFRVLFVLIFLCPIFTVFTHRMLNVSFLSVPPKCIPGAGHKLGSISGDQMHEGASPCHTLVMHILVGTGDPNPTKLDVAEISPFEVGTKMRV